MPELLLYLLALPLVTAIVAALLGPGRAIAVRWMSLASTLASLLLAIDPHHSVRHPRIQNAARRCERTADFRSDSSVTPREICCHCTRRRAARWTAPFSFTSASTA